MSGPQLGLIQRPLGVRGTMERTCTESEKWKTVETQTGGGPCEIHHGIFPVLIEVGFLSQRDWEPGPHPSSGVYKLKGSFFRQHFAFFRMTLLREARVATSCQKLCQC